MPNGLKNTIAIFSPITVRCLEVLAAYLNDVDQPTHIYTLPDKRLCQSIAPFTCDGLITHEPVAIDGRDFTNWQNAIQLIVFRAKKLVFFIPPGTRVAWRKTADNKQSWAARFAIQYGRPIERVYVEDTPVAHGKFYRGQSASNGIQMQLPLFDQNPKPVPPIPPPTRPKTSVPYVSPPKLAVPRWWKNNHPPTQTKRWIETNIFEPITAKLKEEGYSIVCTQADNANPLTTATIDAEKDTAKVHVAFTLPMFADAALTAWRQNNNRKTRLMLFTYKATLQAPRLRQKESLRVIEFPEPLKQFAAEYEDWANFPTALKVNSARYYQPGEYREVQSPSKQWELSHIHPLIKAQLEARKVPFVRHVPLGQYIADFIVNAEEYTQIIECKRHPFQYNLRCAIEQLLLYEELYRRLFPKRADREMKLVLALPEGTVTPFVIETALKHRVEVKAIACDPLQTDMIVKKHLAAQVNKLARQISQADRRPIAFTA